MSVLLGGVGRPGLLLLGCRARGSRLNEARCDERASCCCCCSRRATDDGLNTNYQRLLIGSRRDLRRCAVGAISSQLRDPHGDGMQALGMHNGSQKSIAETNWRREDHPLTPPHQTTAHQSHPKLKPRSNYAQTHTGPSRRSKSNRPQWTRRAAGRRCSRRTTPCCCRSTRTRRRWRRRCSST